MRETAGSRSNTEPGGRLELTDELRRRVEQQAAVAELGRLALTGTGTDELRKTAVAFTSAALGTELVSILELDPEEGTLVCRANVGWADDMMRPIPLLSASQIGHTFLTQDPVVVPDLEAEDRFESSKHLLAYGIRSGASVPIRGGEQPLGVLAVHARAARSFSADDVLFLRGVANVLAAAEARELADRARRGSEERLRFVAEASHVLARSLDPKETLDALAHLVVPRLADWCVVHLLEGGQLVPAAVVHSDPELVARRQRRDLPLDMAMPTGPAAVVRTGEPELVAEVTAELIADSVRDPEHRQVLLDLGMTSTMCVPLSARGALQGTVSFVSTDPARRYGEEDLALAEELARRAALAVDNALLHDAAQTARGRAVRLQGVTSRLAGSLTPEEVIEVVLSEGLDATGAAAALVALVEGDGDQVRVVAERGYAEGQLSGWETFPVDEELPVSVVVRTGEPVFCTTRAERDERFPRLAVLDQPSHALVSLPLSAGRGPLGAIVLSFGGERRFEDEEQAFLQAIANQCAQALERAQLYREAERRAEAAQALAFVADGVALVDEDGIVRLWNDAAARITGLDASLVEGTRLEESLPGWAACAERLPVVPAGADLPRPVTLPLELDGGERWLSIAGVAFAEGTVYAFRDVSEEQGLERMKSDFIATVSHELRTPLAAVYGAAATLRSRPTLDEEERERFLDMISEQSERLSRIVSEILIASRLDAGELPLALEGVDAAEIARHVVEIALRGAPEGFAIDVSAEPGLPPVRADRDRLRQVLANLVENAVKYSGESERAEVRVEGGDGVVRIAVRDFGIGIPAAEQQRIFAKFYRVDPSMSRGVSGTGLGLYIVRELVRRMGGTIRLQSEPGRGSTFTVELQAPAPIDTEVSA